MVKVESKETTTNKGIIILVREIPADFMAASS
jgi:hypothetical protein